jgi:GNAT superfamily N-acetyltransferase
VDYRRTSEADFAAECAVFTAAEGGVIKRHGFEWTDPDPEPWALPHKHLLAHDGERSWVAEEGGRIVGFTAAFARDDAWFLSALFVHPEVQARGVGQNLLERSWGGDYPRRLTITDAIQPISNAIYARRGLVPTTPILWFSGSPQIDRGSDLESAEPDADALAAIDRAAYGFDRSVDHEYWRSRCERSTLWLRAGEPVAHAYVMPSGQIGPLEAVDGASAGEALAASLARREGRETFVLVPGSAAELVSTAFAAGLRLRFPPGLLLLTPNVPAPRALAISNYWLL